MSKCHPARQTIAFISPIDGNVARLLACRGAGIADSSSNEASREEATHCCDGSSLLKSAPKRSTVSVPRKNTCEVGAQLRLSVVVRRLGWSFAPLYYLLVNAF